MGDLVAPKLSRDEEIYALSLADGAHEIFGEDVANLIRGEGVISVKSAQIVLNAVMKGGAANTILTSSGAGQINEDIIEQVTDTLSNLLNSLEKDSGSNELNEVLSNIDDLSADERERLDDITHKIIDRSFSKARVRLAGVPRLF